MKLCSSTCLLTPVDFFGFSTAVSTAVPLAAMPPKAAAAAAPAAAKTAKKPKAPAAKRAKGESRNYLLPGGVERFGRSTMHTKRGIYKYKTVRGAGGPARRAAGVGGARGRQHGAERWQEDERAEREREESTVATT